MKKIILITILLLFNYINLSAQTVTLTNSCIPPVNGTYTLSSTTNNKPSFVNGNYRIEWSGTRWEMKTIANIIGSYNNSDTPNPPSSIDSAWTYVNCSGSVFTYNPPPPPEVTSANGNSITTISAILGGNVTDDNGNTVTERGIIYSITDATPEIGETGVIKDTNGTGTGVFSETINGLTKSTTYFYRAYAINSEGTGYGAIKSFTTHISNATTTVDFEEFTTWVDGADHGSNSITSKKMKFVIANYNSANWIQDTNEGTSNSNALAGHGLDDDAIITITGENEIENFDFLSFYFIRKNEGYIDKIEAYTNNGLTKKGETIYNTPQANDFISLDNNLFTNIDKVVIHMVSSPYYFTEKFDDFVFNTSAIPNVLSIDATNIGKNTVDFSGNVVDDNGFTVTERGVVYSSTDQTPEIGETGVIKDTNGTGTGVFSETITNLTKLTTYYYRAYAISSEGIGYGEVKSFTTLTDLPTIITTSVNSISATTASISGNVTLQGDSVVTERGVLYSTTDTNPTINDANVTKDVNGTAGIGTFLNTITGLTTNTAYFFRTYATNSQGTAYGTVKRLFVNHALHFDKANDRVTIPDNAAFDFSSGFTIEAWIKPSSFSGNPTIFSQYSGSQRAFAVIIKSDGTVENTISTNGSNDVYYTTNDKLTINTWQHVAFTFDGTTMKFYINGTEASGGSVTGTTGTLFDSSADIELGARANNLFYGGEMDEVRIWTKTLTSAEINAQKDAPINPNTANLVAYYNFNQGLINEDNTAITALTDNTSNSLNGTLNNFALTGTTSNFVAGVNSGNFSTKTDQLNVFNTTGNWNVPANWSLGILPTQIDKVTIATGNTVTINVDDLVIDNFTLETGATITIPADKEITIQNEFATSGNLELLSDKTDSGVLFIEGTSTGNITYTRGGLVANEWSIVTPPVAGQTIKTFAEDNANNIRQNTSVSPVRYAIATYDDAQTAGNKWVYYDANVNATDEFVAGQSYSMSRATSGSVSFTGTLAVEDLNKTLIADAWNAIGNPFTTYFPANKNSGSSFLSDNLSKLDVNFPSVYIWDATQNKYVAVTELDATARSLPPGQGFFIKMKTGETSIIFNKEKRSTKPTTGTTDFSKNESPADITLTITKGKTAVNTSIKFFDNATAGFDTGYDIGNFDSSDLDIYSHLADNSNTNNYTIQSLSNSNFDGVVIPISINAKKGDNISISGAFTNIPSDIKVYLEDRNTNSFTELSVAAQKEIIIENDGTTKNRFFIHLSQKALNTHSTLLTDVAFYSNQKSVYIHNVKEAGTFELHSLLGTKVYQQKISANAKTEIFLNNLGTGLYLATVKTNSGTITKKIVLE